MAHFPALSAVALLAAFGALGLDVQRLRAVSGLPDRPATPGTLLGPGVWADLWREARRQAPEPELATRAGLHVPFGAFGLVDYLVGSAETVEGALQSLAGHLPAIASGFALSLEQRDTTRAVLCVLTTPGEVGAPDDSEEFTLATVVGRLRRIAPPVQFTRVQLTRRYPVATRHEELLATKVEFGAVTAGLELSSTALQGPLATADATLHQTMRQIAAQLGLGEAAHPLEVAVRARLRTLLPAGRVSAAEVARSLGLSERTLHRKLAEAGRPFQEIVDTFRTAESERLLLAGEPLATIAAQLGFSEPSAWARAFRRWTGGSPTSWLVDRRRGQRPL